MPLPSSTYVYAPFLFLQRTWWWGTWARLTLEMLPCSPLLSPIINFAHPCSAADLVVGYMGVPYLGGDMTSHLQYMTVRNERGQEMLEAGGRQWRCTGGCGL